MDNAKPFFETTIDRTPYPTIYWLVSLLLVIFLVGSTLLWQIAGKVKRSHLGWQLSKPQENLQSAVEQALNPHGQSSATPTFQQQLDAEKKSLEQQAIDSAKQKAGQALQQQADQLKTQNSPDLQHYLNQ